MDKGSKSFLDLLYTLSHSVKIESIATPMLDRPFSMKKLNKYTYKKVRTL